MSDLVRENRRLALELGIPLNERKELPTKTSARCPKCGTRHELSEPVLELLHVWCDPCWHPMSEEERGVAIDGIRETEKAAVRQAAEDGYDVSNLPAW